MTALGCETPRLWTPPLRPLTPDTSLGFNVIEFAETFCTIEGRPVRLLPWQKWWLIHALELHPTKTDPLTGRPVFRFRKVLTLLGRQNGKTTLLTILAVWAMCSGRLPHVLGVAKDLSLAAESWNDAIEITRVDPSLRSMWMPGRETNTISRSKGDFKFRLKNGSEYKIKAANEKAGRGQSIDLLIFDEFRLQKNDDAWNALAPTTNARPNAIIVCISNAGDDQSVVLNRLREVALAETDPRTGLFEWSAPDGCELTDRDAWAQANPGLGITIDEDSIASSLATETPAGFRTEVLCQRVTSLDGAVDLTAWQSCADNAGDMGALRDRVALCLDVSPTQKHVTLVAAATRDDGRVRLEVVAAWDSPNEARQALPALLRSINPRVLGWFPGGPAAALAADLRAIAKTQEIKAGEVTAVCLGFAEQVSARRIVHPNDPLLNLHVAQAEKMSSGDGWRFSRANQLSVDAVYAAAGAVHLARTAAPSVGKPRIIVAA